MTIFEGDIKKLGLYLVTGKAPEDDPMAIPTKLTEPATKEAIDTAQKQLGLALPASYKAFLLIANGGSIEGYASYNFYNEALSREDDCLIGEFFNLSTLVEANKKDWDLMIPKDMLMVCSNSGDTFNILLMDVSTSSIYLWDRDNQDPDSGEAFNMQDCFMIAATFDEFIKGIEVLGELTDEELAEIEALEGIGKP